MRYLLLTLVLIAGCVSADNIIVIGDSISAGKHSWANQYRNIPGNRLKLLAQSGRAIVDYDVPRDLHPFLGPHRVYYVLGGNDMGDRMLLPQIYVQLTRHLGALTGAGFDVTMVIPPRFSGFEANADKVRAVMLPFCEKVKCIDLNEIWHAVDTDDGIHPTESGSRVILEFINP
jgi:hypothetical protein